MGWLTGKSKQVSVDRERFALEAAEQSRKAREEGQKADASSRSLRSGKSTDPAAARQMIRQHKANQRIYQANARDLRKMAKRTP